MWKTRETFDGVVAKQTQDHFRFFDIAVPSCFAQYYASDCCTLFRAKTLSKRADKYVRGRGGLWQQHWALRPGVGPSGIRRDRAYLPELVWEVGKSCPLAPTCQVGRSSHRPTSPAGLTWPLLGGARCNVPVLKALSCFNNYQK